MSAKKVLMTIAATAAIFAGSAAHAVDGCAVLICLVKGGSGFSECKGILKDFYRDTALGKPPPRCKKASSPSVPVEVSSQAGYSTAASGAGATDANPYGDKITAEQYANATTGAATAAAEAQVQAEAGIRAVDTTALMGTDASSTAESGATDASASAAASVAQACATCEVTPDATLVDESIKTEVTADLVAEGLIPDPATTTTTTAVVTP